MTHFALICPPFQSHLRVFETLGAELQARGHRATLLVVGPAPVGLATRNLTVLRLDDQRAEAVFQRLLGNATRPTGPFGVLRTVRDSAALTAYLCETAPAILKRIGAQAILGDQMEPASGLLAAHLGLPFVSIASALPIEREPDVPPLFLDWSFDPSENGRKRNRGAEMVTHLVLRRQRLAIENAALSFGLPGLSSAEDCLSPLATISQTVAGFDMPRRCAPRLHHVGPIRPPQAGEPALPFRVKRDRPLVYASFGTLQGHRYTLFRTIARVCETIGAQLVATHLGGLTGDKAARLPALHVAADLPQRAVLARASVCVTHGGLNTTMDALEHGVPLLVLPIAFDQPGVAARVAHHGVGLKMSRVLLSERSLRSSLLQLIHQKGFQTRAQALGEDIKRAGGVRLAVDIIEECVGGTRTKLRDAVA